MRLQMRIRIILAVESGPMVSSKSHHVDRSRRRETRHPAEGFESEFQLGRRRTLGRAPPRRVSHGQAPPKRNRLDPPAVPVLRHARKVAGRVLGSSLEPRFAPRDRETLDRGAAWDSRGCRAGPPGDPEHLETAGRTSPLKTIRGSPATVPGARTALHIIRATDAWNLVTGAAVPSRCFGET